MRIQSSLLRRALCGLAVGASLTAARPAAAEVTLIEKDGWTFFTDGRANAFLSQGIGDAFPAATQNPNVNVDGAAPQHTVVGSGNPFTAGYESFQADANGKYRAARIRNGFLATVLAFGMKRQLSETTTVKSYISLWGTAQSFQRDRALDYGNNKNKGFDVRDGFVDFEGPWGGVIAGRQGGVFGHMSAEIDFLYGHNYGLGLPCLDDFYASCGHIGTGALGPGWAAGMVYTTPSLGGLKLSAGLFDPVRLLGSTRERVPYPRPEGALTFEQELSAEARLKLQVEGMYQFIASPAADVTDKVWGVAGGGRVEVGPLRLGLSAFHGKGLGAYVALQNSPSSFNTAGEFRTFTGFYAQSAVLFGPMQISVGAGRVNDAQLESDKRDASTSGLKSQTGLSVAYYVHLSENLVLGVDYFRFQTDWWGAPNSTFDAALNTVILPGVLAPEKQVIHFINTGVTFHW